MMREMSSWYLVFLIPFSSAIIRKDTIKDAQFSSVQGMALIGHLLEVHNVASPIGCSYLCIANDKCKSINYKPGGAGDKDLCQLNNATRKTNAASYKPDAGFIHYFDKEETFKSCLDYLRNGAQENGIYTITDTSGSSYEVFCDVTSERRSAWTLIMSQALKNSPMPEFCTVVLTKNAPVQENTPNWEAYRLSLSRMQHLSQQSTHLRITTGFQKYGVDFVDYLRAKISDINILTFIGRRVCMTLEYINIRGNIGKGVAANFWQTNDQFMFHIDAYSNSCGFDAKSGAIISENSFGAYCYPEQNNPKFRGTANNDSTTEYWFGGYL